MKVFNPKTKRNEVVFYKYEINSNTTSCPQCQRPFKEENIRFLNNNGFYICGKCNSKLIIK